VSAEPRPRVAFITGEYPKASETFLLRELRELAHRGLDFVVVATKRLPDIPEAGGIDAPVLLRPPLFSLRSIGAKLRFAFSHPLRGVRILFALLAGHWRRPGECIRVLVNLPRALAVGYELRRLGVRRVHALWASFPATLGWIIAGAFDFEFSFAAHSWDVYVGGRMLREKIELARAVVACSRSVADRLVEIAGPSLVGKIALVHHGIDTEKLPARSAEPTGMILAAGRFEPKKGFDVLIDACRLLAERGRPVHCVIVGDGPLKERLEDLARRARGARVELRPWMHHDELMHLVASAALLAVPSVVAPSGDRDGIPNILLEALAMGAPVVATDVGGIPEVVRDAETGFLVKPGQSAPLADKIARILDEKGRNRDISRRGMELIRQEWTLRQTVLTLETLLTG
jgi:glycosyltransferase involved in cell wall biosynthesis